MKLKCQSLTTVVLLNHLTIAKTILYERHTLTSSIFYNFDFFVLLTSCFLQQTLVTIGHIIWTADTFYYFGTSMNARNFRFMSGSLWRYKRKMVMLNNQRLYLWIISLSYTMLNKKHTSTSSIFHNFYFFVLLTSCFCQQALVVISHVIRTADSFDYSGTSFNAGGLWFIGGNFWQEGRKRSLLKPYTWTCKSYAYLNKNIVWATNLFYYIEGILEYTGISL